MSNPHHVVLPPTDDPFHHLVQRIDAGARLLRAWPLLGGVSARVTALDVGRVDGQTTKLVVRQHGAVDREQNPDIARDEFALLQIVRAHGVATPAPVYLDETRDLFPDPVVVVSFVEGDAHRDPPDLAAFLDRTAAELAKIHAIPAGPDLAFLPRLGPGFSERLAILDTAMGEDRIRDALESSWPLATENPSVLLHGDYWRGNILWHEGDLAAVIDWEDAAIGDPLADLGNARLEMLWGFGPAAMNAFTDRYAALAPVDLTNLPDWDLRAALRPCGKLATWGLDPETERRMRHHHYDFVAAALATLEPTTTT